MANEHADPLVAMKRAKGRAKSGEPKPLSARDMKQLKQIHPEHGTHYGNLRDTGDRLQKMGLAELDHSKGPYVRLTEAGKEAQKTGNLPAGHKPPKATHAETMAASQSKLEQIRAKTKEIGDKTEASKARTEEHKHTLFGLGKAESGSSREAARHEASARKALEDAETAHSTHNELAKKSAEYARSSTASPAAVAMHREDLDRHTENAAAAEKKVGEARAAHTAARESLKSAYEREELKPGHGDANHELKGKVSKLEGEVATAEKGADDAMKSARKSRRATLKADVDDAHVPEHKLIGGGTDAHKPAAAEPGPKDPLLKMRATKAKAPKGPKEQEMVPHKAPAVYLGHGLTQTGDWHQQTANGQTHYFKPSGERLKNGKHAGTIVTVNHDSPRSQPKAKAHSVDVDHEGGLWKRSESVPRNVMDKAGGAAAGNAPAAAPSAEPAAKPAAPAAAPSHDVPAPRAPAEHFGDVTAERVKGNQTLAQMHSALAEHHTNEALNTDDPKARHEHLIAAKNASKQAMALTARADEHTKVGAGPAKGGYATMMAGGSAATVDEHEDRAGHHMAQEAKHMAKSEESRDPRAAAMHKNLAAEHAHMQALHTHRANENRFQAHEVHNAIGESKAADIAHKYGQAHVLAHTHGTFHTGKRGGRFYVSKRGVKVYLGGNHPAMK